MGLGLGLALLEQRLVISGAPVPLLARARVVRDLLLYVGLGQHHQHVLAPAAREGHLLRVRVGVRVGARVGVRVRVRVGVG